MARIVGLMGPCPNCRGYSGSSCRQVAGALREASGDPPHGTPGETLRCAQCGRDFALRCPVPDPEEPCRAEATETYLLRVRKGQHERELRLSVCARHGVKLEQELHGVRPAAAPPVSPDAAPEETGAESLLSAFPAAPELEEGEAP